MTARADQISAGTARGLAGIALLLGVACAVVNGWFFALGLERLEPDAAARAPLLLAGWLMVASEHVAVGLAALLPVAFAGLRRQLKGLGLALLVFECVSMFTAQRALEHVSVAQAGAQSARAAGLRAAIDSQRATLEQLRDNGARQSASGNAWRQHLGATALRASLASEQQTQALEVELASLQATSRPTLTGVLGESGAAAFAAARALLIGVMGLVLLSAAGQLWAAGRAAAMPGQVGADTTAPATTAGTAATSRPDAAAQHKGLRGYVALRPMPAMTSRARDRPDASAS